MIAIVFPDIVLYEHYIYLLVIIFSLVQLSITGDFTINCKPWTDLDFDILESWTPTVCNVVSKVYIIVIDSRVELNLSVHDSSLSVRLT